MHDVFALLDQVRVRTAQANDSLAARHGLGAGDPPINALNMVNQYAVMAMELTSFYFEVWSKLRPDQLLDPEATKRENGERIVGLTKSAFIMSVSSLEFAAKSAIVARPSRLPAPTGRVYLRKIIKDSDRAGLIAHAEDSPWEGIIEVRNVLVHNNGIADRDASFTIPGGPTIQLKSGKMTQGNLRFFPELTLWAVDSYSRWADAFLT
jgi:hypothetical protein